MLTSDVENFPGFVEPVAGQELVATLKKQAERFGTRFVLENVTSANLTSSPMTLSLSNNTTIETRTVIIATGASARWLGLQSETRLQGKGVSACATCDGFFFKNRDVAVVGGGDTALEEAIFLTRFAKSVVVVHRRSQLRASKILQDRANANPKISFVWDSTVDEVLGDDRVSGIKVRNLNTQVVTELKLSGLFIAIGHDPNTGVFRDAGVKCDANGYVVTDKASTRTSLPGVFAAGDVADSVYRQAITAAGTGCMAAIDCERFLEAQESLDGHTGKQQS